MVAAAELATGERVLEIGTGLGYLTDELLKTGATVFSLEYDTALHARNLKKYGAAEIGNLRLIRADIRHFNWGTIEAPLKVCANIPYYLSANLLRQLSDLEAKPVLAVLLMDASVAEKLAAREKRTLLAVIVQSHYEVELGQSAAPELFQPPPKVTSKIAILRHRPAAAGLTPANWPKFVRLLKAGFSSRRKQLGVNLRDFLGLSKAETEAVLVAAGIDPRQRAEELTDERWQRLFANLHDQL